jgi:hypothetical protein
MTGYSGTPLAQKLSLKDGMNVWADCMPETVKSEIKSAGRKLRFVSAPKPPVEAAHLFVTRRDVLDCKLRLLLPLLHAKGFVWVSWPKKASKVDTDITEDTIRDIALPMGLVDVKVCAVDETWSGLKLVIRQQKSDVR